MIGFWEATIIMVLTIVITYLITWYSTKKTIQGVAERVSEIMAKYIGEAIKAIHADIAHSQRKLEVKLKGQVRSEEAQD